VQHAGSRERFRAYPLISAIVVENSRPGEQERLFALYPNDLTIHDL
jgi:hypothetical protein